MALKENGRERQSAGKWERFYITGLGLPVAGQVSH